MRSCTELSHNIIYVIVHVAKLLMCNMVHASPDSWEEHISFSMERGG